MSRIPKKKSRRITINGIPYRWMLKGKSKYIGNTAEVMDLTVQREEEKPGGVYQTLLVSKWLDEHELGDDNDCSHKATVYPDDIRKCIEHALNTGWDPKETGAFTSPSVLELKEYRAQPASWAKRVSGD